MKRISIWAVCGLLLMALCSAAYAQFAKPQDAVDYRQAVMTLMNNHLTRIAAMIKGDKPFDKPAVAQSASLIATLSKLPWEAFSYPGSDKGKTNMKPEALKNQEDFKALGLELEKQTAKLSQAADSGNQDEIKTQFGATAKTCKACHDKYRK